MFDRKTFLGASIRNIQSSIGWNGNPGQLNVNLVEDTTNGDLFSPPQVGQPIYFEIGSSRFYGLLDKYTLDKSSSGFIYNVSCSDPRKLLDKTKLILESYNSSTYGIKNLLNVYGYLENNLGFGGSQINSTGIPWKLIRNSILNLVNGGSYGTFGGPITYKGYSYTINLSELPNDLPEYFRIGGFPSLLEYIQTICEYTNHDFFIELVGLQIKLRTVSRYAQPQLGTLTTLINSYNANNLIRSSAGVESRDEINSSFLIGGEVTELHASTEIAPFYGLDINNEPIIGTAGKIDFKNNDGNVIYSEDTYFFNLDSTVVGGILGLPTYPCSEFELRIIAHGGTSAYGNWISYIKKFRPDIASRLDFPFLTSLEIPPLRPGLPGMPIDLFRIGVREILVAVNAARSANAVKKVRTFFEWLRGIAQAHLGRTYLVKLPFLLSKIEPESERLITSYEVTNEAFFDETTNTLGEIDSIRRELLASNDGRYPAIGVIWNSSGFDLTKAWENESVIAANNDFYTKVNVNPKIYFVPEPAVIVTLPQPAFQEINEKYEALGTILNTRELGFVIGGVAGALIPPEAPRPARPGLGASATVSFKIHPRPVLPNVFHIPLKSNILTYGPWYAIGENGNVRCEQDSTLVPWNYGGISFMNLAASAKVGSSISNTTVIETGMLELEGLPSYSLGDVLDANGPNVTDISVSYSVEQGVSTTYRFSTYVPRFGQIGKFLQDRIRSIGLISQQYARTAKEKALETGVKSNRIRDTIRSNYGYLASLPRGIARETPFNILLGVTEKGDGDDGGVRHGVSTVDLAEAVFMLGTGDEYTASTAQTFNSLLSPISIFGSGRYMSRMGEPSGAYYGLTSYELNPYKVSVSGWSTDIFTFGDSYPESGINTAVNLDNVGSSTRRVLVNKGPMMLTGWGYDLEGHPVPGHIINASGEVIQPHSSGAGQHVFSHNYLSRPDIWKTGPIDLLWDDNRKVWTSHSLLIGKAETVISTSGLMSLWSVRPEAAVGSKIEVFNWGGSEIAAGEKVFAGYNPNDNKWHVISPPASIPGGSPYTVYHTPSSGNPVWSSSPIIKSITLGGGYPSGVNYDGYIELGRTGQSGLIPTRIFAGVRTSGAINWTLPTGVASAGDILKIESYSINDLTLKWDRLDEVGTGTAYTLLHTNKNLSRSWSTSPTITSLTLGASGFANGFLEITTSSTGTSSFSRIFSSERSSSINFYLPSGVPAAGDGLYVKSWNGSDAVLDFRTFGSGVNVAGTGYIFESEFNQTVVGDNIQIGANWGSIVDIGTVGSDGSAEFFARSDHVHKHPVFLSGDMHPEYNLPTGIPYSVLWSDGTNTKSFSRTPYISGIYLGGSGIGFGDGFVGLGSSGNQYRQYFWTSTLNSDVNLFFGQKPSATGQILTVESYSGNNFNLKWESINNVPPTGVTKTFDYVSNVECVGTGIVVTKRTLTYSNGRLINEY